MNESSMKSVKITESKRPETTIVATIEVIKIIDDQMLKPEDAAVIINDIINGIDADHYEIKDVKYFEMNMEG